MQDIRRPYSHSRSKKSILDERVEEFENADYRGTPKNDDSVKAFFQKENRPRRFADVDVGFYGRKRDPYTKRSRSLEMWIFTGIILALVVIFALFTYVLDSATVTITPKYIDQEVNRVITFDKSGQDGVSFVIATATLQKNKELPKGDAQPVETKAQGTIIVYNNYDGNIQRLVKNTRFESPDGKIYRINDSISVPGKVGDKPGSIEVTIYADSYGEEYNIPPSDFTIPGFKGTPRYSGFYARSKGAITGGSSGTKRIVAVSDLNAAKDELAIAMTQDLKNQLKKKEMENHINVSTGIQVKFDDNEKQIMAGETSTYKVTATGYVMFVPESDLAETLAKSQSQYNNEPLRIDREETLRFSLRDETDLSKDTKFDALLEGSPRLVWKIDEEKIRLTLSGKGKDDFVEVMNSFSGVQKAEMDFFPIWLTGFPESLEKIEIIEKLPALAN